MHDATALIVAAGRGLRVGGGVPKQWRPIAGRAVAARSADAFVDRVDVIIAVIHPDDRPTAEAVLPGVSLVEGRDTRAGSVAAGLAAVRTELVLIHDAARPFVSSAVIDDVLHALRDGADGAAPGVAVTDALWQGGEIVTSVQPRDGLWRAQTPQGFRTAAIRAAHSMGDATALDDVAVAIAAGMDVRIVPGEEGNVKITTPDDFAEAERRLAPALTDLRVGHGYDVHRFGPGDGVVLCGVRLPHDRALQGHSDADVGLHVLCDALYGAMAQGDIGRHFPPSDPQWGGHDSAAFFRHAVALAAERGWRISSLDVTLICERPKIGPHADAMRARVAELAKLDPDRISVKATTTERLGFTGRAEGIAASATATLVR